MTVKIKRRVMRIWWFRPWNIVKWVYVEEDKNGMAVLKKQGTNFLYKVLIMGAVLWVCNFGLALIGVENHKATLGIYIEVGDVRRSA